MRKQLNRCTDGYGQEAFFGEQTLPMRREAPLPLNYRFRGDREALAALSLRRRDLRWDLGDDEVIC